MKCNFPNFKYDELREAVSVVSLFHDFGKATLFFQEYLEYPNRSSNDDTRRKRRHGLVSAITAYQILKKKFPENSILPVFGFIIVRKHHGNLEDYRKLLIISKEDERNCQIQAEHINYEELQQIIKIYDVGRILIDGFRYRDMQELRRKDREFSTEHYFAINLLYSILLHADKTDAILNDENVRKSKFLNSKDVFNYKNGFNNNSENPIDAIRESAFQSVEKTIETLDEAERILSINIPTGSGKTITSLNAALRLCEKFGHDHVVYCLPFTSVIDQNFLVFDDIRKNANLPEDSGILLKHHHLADIRYNSVMDENVVKEYLPNVSLHLIEGWESRITVTTFVQFIYSLISYKNASLQKFHRFNNTVIILDEVQSLPHHYWKLVNEMLSKMAEWLNSRIVLVTATMPLIFSEQDGEIKELVSEKKEMFASLNRIELDVSNLKNEKMEWKDFCESSKKIVNDNPTKDILFVMNTIRSAKDLYFLFSELDIPHKIEFLSAHIIPKDRLHRITSIKNRNQNEPKLVVSTQLVEAGVDIDLDIVVRDFAPLDSIFQTCGRCNRENRNGVKGKVILFSLKDSNDWIPSGIYNNFLKQKTKKILDGKGIIPETEFFELAYDYFHEVQIGGSQTQSDNLLEKIGKLKYADGDEKIEIKLIDDHYSGSIFIEFDDQAEKHWNNYQQVLEMESGFEKKSLLKQVQRNLAEYIINIPNKCLPDGCNDGIYYLCKNQVKEFYNPITGFKLGKQLPQKTDTLIF